MKLAVAGVGYWGVNHVRAFARQKGCTLAALCDAAALDRAAVRTERARRYAAVDALLADGSIDAVVLATPAVEHAAQAQAALACR